MMKYDFCVCSPFFLLSELGFPLARVLLRAYLHRRFAEIIAGLSIACMLNQTYVIHCWRAEYDKLQSQC